MRVRQKQLPTLELKPFVPNHALRAASLFTVGWLLLLPLTGCVTKAQADAQARIAFLQGQNEALMRMQKQQPQPAAVTQPLPQMNGLSVSFVGPVQNPVVPWRIGLTLTQAIVGAGYIGQADPRTIMVLRDGLNIAVNPKGLLNGEDFVLEIGDVITLQQ